jgi:hypothetical protein
MNIYMAGRNIGKSVIRQLWYVEEDTKPICKIVTSSMVDGCKWLTIFCSKPIADWVRNQENCNKEWYEHIDHNWNVDRSKFDVSEEFYLMLKLRWGL